MTTEGVAVAGRGLKLRLVDSGCTHTMLSSPVGKQWNCQGTKTMKARDAQGRTITARGGGPLVARLRNANGEIVEQIAARAFVSESIAECLISLPELRRLGWAVFARPHDTPILVAPSPKDGPAEATGHVFPLSEDELGHFWLPLEVVPAECESATEAAEDERGPADEATDDECELARAATALRSSAPLGEPPGAGLAYGLDERVVSGVQVACPGEPTAPARP